MSFEAVLRQILDDCDGAQAVAFMGPDGIPIEQVEAGELDMAALGVEFGRILGEARKAADVMGGGELHEMAVGMGRFWVLLRLVDDENFLIVALGPDANVGKARYVMRRQLAVLREQL